jgi:hypothetical protein
LKPSGRNLNLTSYDEIFQTEETRIEATQIKTTRVNGWFALRLKAFVTNQPLKGL